MSVTDPFSSMPPPALEGLSAAGLLGQAVVSPPIDRA
jgi:hypothetical protein